MSPFNHNRGSEGAGVRVAVIGAGISGLACAGALGERGFDVRVFDKGRAPGGRTSTRRAEIGGAEVGFDHGAQYFTVREPEFCALAAKWEKTGVVSRWDGRIVAIENSGAFEPSSVKTRFVGTPTMSALCKHLAADQDVRCGVTVGSVVRCPRGVELFDLHGGSLGAYDYVVCSAPPAQTESLLSELAPELAARAATVRMKPCWAVMVAFDLKIDVPFDGAFINLGPLSWIARTSSKPGRTQTPDRWVLHASADWSADQLEETLENVTQPLLDAFFGAIGRPKRASIFVRAHRWRYALADNPLEEACLFDASKGLAVCGDWTNGNRIEGAFLSGLAAARQLDRMYSRPRTV
ncbi:MAG: FAD-dependent oxidoreductase [Polyangiales bacterium]